MCTFEQNDLDRLKEEVEQLVGRKIKSPKDFDFLSRQIAGLVEESVSVSTLTCLSAIMFADRAVV